MFMWLNSRIVSSGYVIPGSETIPDVLTPLIPTPPIAAAPHPGVSLVTVVTAEGRVLGETSFTYRDLRSEAQLEVERLLDEAFGWSGEERPRSPDDRAQHLSAIQEGEWPVQVADTAEIRLSCGHLGTQSAVTAQNDDFSQGSFHNAH